MKNWLHQKSAHLKKEEFAHRKKIDITNEDYIVTMEYWEQCHCHHCWTTAGVAISVIINEK